MRRQIDIIEEAVRLVDAGICVTLPVTGQSMLPFIVGGSDSVILQKPERVNKGMVVLAWVDGNRYVIHRIIEIDDNSISLMGDGNISGVEHCSLKDIKAYATHVVSRDGKEHFLYSKKRRLTANLWYWLRPMRRYLLAIYRRI